MRISITLVLSLSFSLLLAQQDSTAPRKLKPAEVNFLFSYYEQDGFHSPVTGGWGTEFLTDQVYKATINIPLDSSSSLNAMRGVDTYTSASTDNINNSVSSASEKDQRQYADLGYAHENTTKRTNSGFNIGYSNEWDVFSLNASVFWSKQSKDKNKEWVLRALAFRDKWDLIYPSELRVSVFQTGEELVKDSVRWLYSVGTTYNRVINRRMQGSVSAEVVYQRGLLSTPFHRVYFADVFVPDVEQLPDQRIKVPLGFRLNYYLTDFLLLRIYQRFYYDDFGILASTSMGEAPIKLIRYFTFYPFYRFHTQTASQYFKPFGQHLSSGEFYTSDFDLSAFQSYKMGIGVRYSPLYGIGRRKAPENPKMQYMFKEIQVRYAQYFRSDGLWAYIISAGASFTF